MIATQVKSALDAIVFYSVVANRPEQFRHLPAGTPPSVVGQFELMGDPINIIPTVGFFITMVRARAALGCAIGSSNDALRACVLSCRTPGTRAARSCRRT